VFEFHPVVAKLQIFCSEDLGGFYLDVLKDRLYTSAPNSPARRAAQTALYEITHGLLRVMAPFLSFTAEEAWRVFQPGAETIFTETYLVYPEVPGAAALVEKWKLLRQVRGEVSKALEEARVGNRIGSSLQAEIEVRACGARYDALASLGDDLKFVMITSAARLVKVDQASEESVLVETSRYLKCERCWHYREEIGSIAEHPTLCGRCFSNLFGSGEVRSAA
jgi:isoleucyl-tRNA synthetase